MSVQVSTERLFRLVSRGLRLSGRERAVCMRGLDAAKYLSPAPLRQNCLQSFTEYSVGSFPEKGHRFSNRVVIDPPVKRRVDWKGRFRICQQSDCMLPMTPSEHNHFIQNLCFLLPGCQPMRCSTKFQKRKRFGCRRICGRV